MKVSANAFLTAVHQATRPRGVLTSVHESDIAVDILIPAIGKDADTLSYCISHVRKYLRHPIGDVFLVAPPDKRIEQIAKQQEARFIDERDLSLPNRKEINFVSPKSGEDRGGWILQQLIKLSGDQIVSQEHYYVIDADTVLTRSQSFQHFSKILFLLNDYFTIEYGRANKRICGVGHQTRFCFVSHQMFFRIAWLRELRAAIEKRHGKPWIEAIIENLDRRSGYGFGEYDLYGNWCLANYPEQIQCVHWENTEYKPSLIEQVELDDLNYRSISFHSYLEGR